MSPIQVCKDTTEAVELYEPFGLYLKPFAKLNICVQLPVLKAPGKSISNWEVMEKLKKMIKPEEFLVLKVSKTSLEFIRFEGELENKSVLKTVVSRLDSNTMKLSGYSDVLKIRAAEAKIAFPTRHDWDSYFRDAKHMNEMKPGERPDTIFFHDLPTKWFTDRKQDSNKPNAHILKKAFSVFGEIRYIDIPMLDPYHKDMNKTVGSIQTFSFCQDLTFEAYVQFVEYMGFVKAMDALRGKKLMYQSPDGKAYCANIKVDFDKTKHLSEKNMRKRRAEYEKLVLLEKEKEERVRREREEEEKRRRDERKKQEEEEQRERRRAEKLRKREEHKQRLQEKYSEKLTKEKKRQDEKLQAAIEHRKKLVAQRKLEATKLLTELFDKAKAVVERNERNFRECGSNQTDLKSRKNQEILMKQEESHRQVKLLKQEQLLRERLLKSVKARKEKQTEELREKLRKELAGKNALKSVLVAVQPKLQPVVSSSCAKVDKDKFQKLR